VACSPTINTGDPCNDLDPCTIGQCDGGGNCIQGVSSA
jgi:hypothetical protein